jgi:hypothetical protein
MKKALSAFAILIAVSILAMLGGVYYLTGFNFTAAIGKLLAVWNSIMIFAVNTPWDLPKIIVVAAFGLIVVVDFLVLFKIMRLRKPFVSYLTFLNILFVALLGVLAFIPYYPDGVTPTTLPTVLMGHIATPATAIAGYVLLGAIGLFALCNLIFVILSFIDIAKTPFPLKHTKKERTKKANNKRKSDRDVVADEFGKFQVPVEKTAEPSPSIQEIRHAVKEELKASSRPATPTPEKQPEPTPAPAAKGPLTLEEIRAIIRDELERSGRGGFDSFRGAPVIYAAPWIGGFPYPVYNQQPGYYPQQQMPAPGVTGASKEDIRTVVSQELEKNIPTKKEIAALVEQEIARLSPTNKESVYSIVNEELIKYDALNREALDSLVTEKVDKYDAINKNLIKSQLSEEIGKYDTENRKAIRTIFTEELQKYDTANKEILHSIIDEELAKKTASIDETHRVLVASEIAKSQEETKRILNEQLGLREANVKQYVAEEVAKNAGPASEELRMVFAEEITRFAKAHESEAKPVEPAPSGITLDEVKTLISQEISKVDVPESEELRSIFAEEIARYLSKRVEEPKPVEPPVAPPVEEPKPVPSEPVKTFVKKAAEPKPVPTPKVEEPAEPLESEDEEGEPDGKGQIIRIPFQNRMKEADKLLLTNYNTLKNYIMSYGVKSRISNSGDTFRLHRETFVKITIAGKGLKLYYALNPQDYDNSTMPVQNVSHKAIYAEIPCVLKVKSPLSVKRAMQLIDDVMKQKGLEQGDIPRINWARDFK